MNFVNDKQEINVYKCEKCYHNCITYNNGKTFGVNDKWSQFIWLEKGEYAPCGKRFKLRIEDISHINYFIYSIKDKYPDINIEYNYDTDDDMYWINHDKQPLDNDHNFNSLVGNLIKELYKKGFTNFCFCYSYEYDKKLHPECF